MYTWSNLIKGYLKCTDIWFVTNCIIVKYTFRKNNNKLQPGFKGETLHTIWNKNDNIKLK